MDCFSIDTQLVGGFLSALINFVEIENANVSSCKSSHTLTGLSTTCSNWHIDRSGDYIAALVIKNDSLLKDVIGDDEDKIINMLFENAHNAIQTI